MRVEKWSGHNVRFIEKEPGEWWGVAQDICMALDIKNVSQTVKKLKQNQKGLCNVYTLGGGQDMLCIHEFGIYKLIFRSNKPEAEQFQDWVCEVLKELRRSTGLEGFQVFRMLDKDHQREAMAKLKDGLQNPVAVDYIKANTIANKAVSTMHGYPKMVKKSDMTPDMLTERQQVLDDTVELMSTIGKFGLGISVSDAIYNKYH